MFEIPAAITKGQIAELVKLVGQANGEAMFDRSRGHTYAPRTQIFIGFAGAIDLADGLYYGTFRFQPVRDDEIDECFDRLPQATDAKPVVFQEDELPEEEVK